MLLPVYNALQTKLDGIQDVKHLDWFNDQYAGTIHAEPGIFIEFPDDIPMATVRKATQQGDLTIRIHVYSKLVPMQDKSLDKSIIEKHFAIVQEVFKRLQGFRAESGDNLLFNSMNRTIFQHHQYMEGWFVTTQDFETMLYEMEQFQEITSPVADVQISMQ